MNHKDQLFEGSPFTVGDFQFDERVAGVFPDMINRSVPGYAWLIPMIGLLARRYAQAGSHIYDLGCSLGAATFAMCHAVNQAGVRFVAVDNSVAMVVRLRQLLAVNQTLPIELRQEDICQTPIEDASVTVLNLTLQFVQPRQRQRLLTTIARGTRPGGVVLLTEKIRFNNPVEQSMQTDWHHDFKRAQGYSELEIASKRNALERVLQPDTHQQHLARLRAAGWGKAARWFQAFNFVSYLAVR